MLFDNLDSGIVLEHLFDAFGAVVRGVLREVAHDDREGAFAPQFFSQVAHLQLPGLNVVRRHGDHAFGQDAFVRVAVDVDQWRLRFDGGTGHVGGGSGVHGQDDDRVDFLVEKALDLIDLANHIALGVLELNLDVVLFGGFLQAAAHIGHEVVVDPGNADTDAIAGGGPLAEDE
ncbi:hypothetical protein D3C73_905460 [compost metagenome]